MPVAEMLARLSSQEISEWRAFFILENEEMEERKLANQSRADVQRRNLR
jgi:hypothetical protein